jgi:hypothetical protein
MDISNDFIDFGWVIGVNHRSYPAQEMCPLVDYSIYRSIAAGARHISLWTGSLATTTGGDAGTQ